MDELNKDEEAQLARTIGCAVGELEEKLEPYKDAAAQEYLRMMLGQRVMTRGSDILEYRLLLLIKYVYKELPDEQTISGVFQTTATGSRTLLRSVMSKYQYELQETIGSTLLGWLRMVEDGEQGDKLISLNSANIIEELNRQIGLIDGHLPKVTKQANTVNAYVVPKDSYDALVLRLEASDGT